MKGSKPAQMNTLAQVDQYQGKLALLQTWEELPAERQLADSDYILELKHRVRSIRNYITHRADPDAEIFS